MRVRVSFFPSWIVIGCVVFFFWWLINDLTFFFLCLFFLFFLFHQKSSKIKKYLHSRTIQAENDKKVHASQPKWLKKIVFQPISLFHQSSRDPFAKGWLCNGQEIHVPKEGTTIDVVPPIDVSDNKNVFSRKNPTGMCFYLYAYDRWPEPDQDGRSWSFGVDSCQPKPNEEGTAQMKFYEFGPSVVFGCTNYVLEEKTESNSWWNYFSSLFF